MAVFDRRYRLWDGARTSPAQRLLVLPRYAYRDLFTSKLFTSLYSASFAVPLGCAFVIWALSNAALIDKLGIDPSKLLRIDGAFFLWLLSVQLFFAAAQTLVIAPALVSPDLVNGALPLYLSRPVSRGQYILGKLTVVGLLLSSITWVPGVLLFGLQTSLVGGTWAAAHLRVVPGLLFGALAGIAVLAVVALTVSAFVRRRAIARGVFIGILVISAAVGENLNVALDTRWGSMLNVFATVEVFCAWLLGARPESHVPVPAAILGLGLIITGSLLLLRRRLRAVEVVK